MSKKKKFHVIPVGKGMSIGDAWMEIKVFGKLVEDYDEIRWAVVEVDGKSVRAIRMATDDEIKEAKGE